MNHSRQRFFLFLILAVIGGFYLATLRPGQRWNDDFSQYIHHALNIVNGRDYRDTGYLYDPITAVIGPRFYPPVFPLLLAPEVALFGLNLTAMKVVVILFFLLFLGVFAWSFKEDLPFPFLATAICILGFNPYFWDIKDNIVSDLPFLFFLYLAMGVIQWSYARPDRPDRRTWKRALLLGLLLYLIFGTRSAGAILVPALFLFEILRLKRLSPFPVIALAVLGVLWLIQHLAIPGSDGYGDQLVFFPRVILNNLHLYFDGFFAIWANGFLTAFQAGLFAILTFFAGWGVFIRLKKGISIYELFAALYLVLLLFWRANQGMRFLIPLAPLFVLYFAQGLVQFWRLAAPRTRITASMVILAAILLSYVGVYSQTSFGPFQEGVETHNSQELFTFIRQNTQAGEPLLFIWPRALALYTGRPASGYSTLENEHFTLGFAQNKGIHYFIVKTGEDYLRLLVKRYPDLFEKVFSNPDFSMYRFKPG